MSKKEEARDKMVITMALTNFLDTLEDKVMDWEWSDEELHEVKLWGGPGEEEFTELFGLLDLQMHAADLLVRMMKGMGISDETITRIITEME